MDQLTVRGFDAELERRLRETGRRYSISLSKAALLLMRRGAGMTDDTEPYEVIGHGLDEFRGTMSEEEEQLILAAVADFEHIDEEMWR